MLSPLSWMALRISAVVRPPSAASPMPPPASSSSALYHETAKPISAGAPPRDGFESHPPTGLDHDRQPPRQRRAAGRPRHRRPIHFIRLFGYLTVHPEAFPQACEGLFRPVGPRARRRRAEARSLGSPRCGLTPAPRVIRPEEA